MIRVLKFFFISSVFLVVFAGGYRAEAADLFGEVCEGKGGATVCRDVKPGDTEECKQDNNSKACKDSQNPIFGKNGVITKIVNLITIIVGIAAVITIILAGIKFITSGSNPQEVTVAREMIIYAIVAVVIAAIAQAIVQLFINRLFA